MAQVSDSPRVLEGRYALHHLIGRGAQGQVYQASDLCRGGQRVAVKVVEASHQGRRDTAADEILRRFRHPNWAEILDVGDLGMAGWFEVTRFVDGRSLAELSGPQREETLWTLLEQGARVLQALHSRGLIHYDVTPGNILLSTSGNNTRFTLTDGGLAHRGPRGEGARGSPKYMAPELTIEGEHDERVDLFSLGLVVYRLATGREAVEGGAGAVLRSRRQHDAPPARRYRSDLDPRLDKVLARLLARAPAGRFPSAGALLTELIGLGAASDACECDPYALLQSGPFPAQGPALERFEAACRVQLGADAGPTDSVLLLEGEDALGLHALVEEMQQRARAHGLGVLLYGAATGAHRPEENLAALWDSLLALRASDGPADVPAPLAGNVYARLERIVALIRRAELVRPICLFVEDYARLAPGDRYAVEALSRYMQEESGGVVGPRYSSRPPLLLVVALGQAPASALLLPEAENPDQPRVSLQPMTPGEIARFVADRLPGLELGGAPLETLHRLTEGRLTVLHRLLAELIAKDLIQQIEGRWHLKAEDLEQVASTTLLSTAGDDDPDHDRHHPQVGRVLDAISLFPVGLPLDASRALYGEAVDHALDSAARWTHVRQTEQGESLAFRTEYLRWAHWEGREPSCRAQAAEALTQELHRAGRAIPAPLADFLRLALGDVKGVLERLSRDDELAGAAAHRQGILREGMRLWPETTARLHAQVPWASWLDAGALGEEICVTLGQLEESLDTPLALAAARVLRATGPGEAAKRVLGRLVPADLPPAQRLAHHLETAHLALDERDLAAIAGTLGSARAVLRDVSAFGEIPPETLSRLTTSRVRYALMTGHRRRARTLAREGYRWARRRLPPDEWVAAENALGISYAASAEAARASRMFRRVRKRCHEAGDIPGQVAVSLNLALAQLRSGDGGHVVDLLQDSLALATRHAIRSPVPSLLWILSNVYDARGEPERALSVLRKHSRFMCSTGVLSSHALWQRFTLAGSLGYPREAEQSLLELGQSQCSPPGSGPSDTVARAVLDAHRGNAGRVREFLDKASARSLESAPVSDSMSQVILLGLAYGGSSDRANAKQNWALIECQDLPDDWRRLARALGAGWADIVALVKRTLEDDDQLLLSGPARRLLIDRCLLGPDPEGTRLPDAPLLEALLRLTRRTGEVLHESRIRALLAAVLAGSAPEDAVAHFSRALMLLDRMQAFEAPSPLPDEVQRAFLALAPLAGRSPGAPPPSLLEAHALAHRLVLTIGTSDRGDRRRERALRDVLDAVARLEASGDPDVFFSSVTQSALDVTGADRACLVQLRGGHAHVLAHAERSAPAVSRRGPLFSRTLLERVLRTRRPLLFHDVFEDDELFTRPSVGQLQLRSLLCVPLVRGEVVHGILCADNHHAAGSFDQVDLEILSLFAEHAAGYLETRRLLEDLQRSLRTLKEAQERLLRGERLRVIGELSSGVAHEFNNLLTAVLARIQLIRLSPAATPFRDDLALMERASMDAAQIIRRLQSFGRSRGGAGHRPTELRQICQEALDFLRPLWSAAGAGRALAVELEAGQSIRVLGDATELRELVTNLVKNSLEALGEEGRVRIRIEETPQAVTLHVADNGSGIPPEILPRVCDPFFTTKGERGTGLGLPLCRQIAEAHGGSFHIRSGPREGTEVTVTFPALGNPLPASRAPSDKSPTPKASRSRRRLRILVVDDDETVRGPLCAFLAQEGHAVSTAASGLEALDRLARPAFDLVLADVYMPGMSGTEFCRRVRRLHPALRVILMSARARGLNEHEAAAAGAASVLAKPFSLESLRETLQNVSA